MQESCYLRGVWGLAPASSAASRMHSRTGGGPEEVSRGIPYTPGGGGPDRGGGARALISHIYICIYIYIYIYIYIL